MCWSYFIIYRYIYLTPENGNTTFSGFVIRSMIPTAYAGVGTQRRQWHPTPVLLPGKSHGRRSLVGCTPWDREESDTTERLHFHFSLSCIGEGNGNPLQCSCLENPRDGGAWWTAVYGVAQSWTRLKWLSSSSRNTEIINSMDDSWGGSEVATTNTVEGKQENEGKILFKMRFIITCKTWINDF